jgi:hypothetical protein
MRIVAAVVVVWLIIGLSAAFQRDYFTDRKESCAEISTTAVTIVAGLLNYLGVNPKSECPRPSQ